LGVERLKVQAVRRHVIKTVHGFHRSWVRVK
jgi:hypothetical protein